jgi:hypothetical protein
MGGDIVERRVPAFHRSRQAKAQLADENDAGGTTGIGSQRPNSPPVRAGIPDIKAGGAAAFALGKRRTGGRKSLRTCPWRKSQKHWRQTARLPFDFSLTTGRDLWWRPRRRGLMAKGSSTPPFLLSGSSARLYDRPPVLRSEAVPLFQGDALRRSIVFATKAWLECAMS